MHTIRLQRPSRAQLNQMLGKVNAKMNAIDQIITFYQTDSSTLNQYYNDLNGTFATKQTDVKTKVQSYLEAQLTCMHDSMINPDDNRPSTCQTYETTSQDLLQLLSEEAFAKADRDEYLWNTRNKESYIQYLKGQKDELTVQHDRLYAMLGEMDPLTGGILDADQLAIANLSDTYKDDNWLQFSFDSTSDYANTDESSSYESISASGGFHLLFFHVGGSYTHTKQTSHFDQQLANSNMKAKGKLLRVNIKRPWFKPEIFEDPLLNFVRCTYNELKI